MVFLHEIWLFYCEKFLFLTAIGDNIWYTINTLARDEYVFSMSVRGADLTKNPGSYTRATSFGATKYVKFDYYDEVLKDIGPATNIDFSKRIRTLDDTPTS